MNDTSNVKLVDPTCPLCDTPGHQFKREGTSSDGVNSSVCVYTCEHCALEYSYPATPACAAHYEEFEVYDVRWEFARVFAETQLRNSRILEIGCGEGFFIEEANRHGNFVVGLDFNQQAVTTANAKNLRADIRCVDATYLPGLRKHDEKFAMVAAFHIIEHLDNPRAFVAACLPLLDEAGYFIFAVPSQKRTNVIFNNREWWDKSPHHLTRWRERSFMELAKRSNLKTDKVIYQQIAQQALHKALTDWVYKKVFGWLGNRGLLYRLTNCTFTPISRLLGTLNARRGMISGNSVLVIMRAPSSGYS